MTLKEAIFENTFQSDLDNLFLIKKHCDYLPNEHKVMKAINTLIKQTQEIIKVDNEIKNLLTNLF